MRTCLFAALVCAALVSHSLQQMEEVPAHLQDLPQYDDSQDVVHGDMIKIPERVLNISRGKTSHFRAINGQDFIDFTINSTSKEGFFVFFGTDWCGHCKKFKPEFEEMAKKIADREEGAAKPLMIYYQVDKDTEHQAKLFRVHGYPSLYYILNNSYWEFDGKREEPDILEWIDKVKRGELSEGKPYPDRLPTFIENLRDGMEETWKVIQIQYKYNFMIFCVIAGCLLLIVSLCCLTVHQLLTEESGDVVPEEYLKKQK